MGKKESGETTEKELKKSSKGKEEHKYTITKKNKSPIYFQFLLYEMHITL